MTVKYTEDHEWLKIEGDVATVGITVHAQDALGDVVFVDLPAVGTTFAQKETAGVVESVKAAADVYMPVSGEVTAINEALMGVTLMLSPMDEPSGRILRRRRGLHRRGDGGRVTLEQAADVVAADGQKNEQQQTPGAVAEEVRHVGEIEHA